MGWAWCCPPAICQAMFPRSVWEHAPAQASIVYTDRQGAFPIQRRPPANETRTGQLLWEPLFHTDHVLWKIGTPSATSRPQLWRSESPLLHRNRPTNVATLSLPGRLSQSVKEDFLLCPCGPLRPWLAVGGESGVNPKPNRSARGKILKGADCLGPSCTPASPQVLGKPP